MRPNGATWRNLPRYISRHSRFDPAWNLEGMAYLHHADRDYHEWTCAYTTGRVHG